MSESVDREVASPGGPPADATPVRPPSAMAALPKLFDPPAEVFPCAENASEKNPYVCDVLPLPTAVETPNAELVYPPASAMVLSPKANVLSATP